MMLRCMVVDDERPAREELSYLLQSLPSITVVGMAESGQEAMKLLQQIKVDVVFLDIHLPEWDGFRIADALQQSNPPPFLVFATAHDEYALKAFSTQAVDYLLKPFERERVRSSVEKIRQIKYQQGDIHKLSGHIEQLCANLACTPALQKIPVEHQGRIMLLDYSEILMIKCQDGVTLVFTEKCTYKVNMTLQELEERLNTNQFFRSHRSFLVNMQKVREMVPWFNGTYNLVVDGISEAVPVSRNQAGKLKKVLGL